MAGVKTVAVVTRGLHSFLYEIARVSKTSGAHYSVRRDGDSVVTIEHHGGRWRARVAVPGREVIVETDDGHALRVAGDAMELDGTHVERICAPGYGCFGAADIRRRAAAALALWELLSAGYGVGIVARVAGILAGEPP